MEPAENCFKEDKGFGSYKPIAIDLLRDTIEILNEFNINYFLISGTLLGYVRHNDFIPWDDDIDLMVDEQILEKLPSIVEKYKSKLNFITRDNYIIKTCYNDKGEKIDFQWEKYLLNGEHYRWPFVDLFLFSHIDNNKIKFYHKEWDNKWFFPLKTVKFNNIDVNIPWIPEFFLFENYGDDCLKVMISSTYSHKNEKVINNIAYLTFDNFIKLKNDGKI